MIVKKIIRNEMGILPKKSVENFLVCFDTVREQFASLNAALNFIGISDDCYKKMVEDGHLRVRNGHKIMNAYAKIKNQVAA